MPHAKLFISGGTETVLRGRPLRSTPSCASDNTFLGT